MYDVNESDILTRVTKYNLIRNGRMLHIDIHESLHGKLADKFVAVPNLISIIAKQEFQGIGKTETDALKDCLEKIKNVTLEEMMPTKPNQNKNK